MTVWVRKAISYKSTTSLWVIAILWLPGLVDPKFYNPCRTIVNHLTPELSGCSIVEWTNSGQHMVTGDEKPSVWALRARWLWWVTDPVIL